MLLIAEVAVEDTEGKMNKKCHASTLHTLTFILAEAAAAGQEIDLSRERVEMRRMKKEITIRDLEWPLEKLRLSTRS